MNPETVLYRHSTGPAQHVSFAFFCTFNFSSIFAFKCIFHHDGLHAVSQQYLDVTHINSSIMGSF